MHKLPKILYFDNHMIITVKPAGMLVQGDRSGDESLNDIIKKFVKEKFNKQGNVYVGLIHRLDRPTSGIVCFAKTSKAAARLSKQFQCKKVEKSYLAIVQGNVPESGTYEDKILKIETNSFLSEKGKIALLSFQKIANIDNYSLIKIDLKTGRHHQIRVQFASRGFPVIGDFRYGSITKFPNQSIGLHAYALTVSHPISNEKMTFYSNPGENWPNYFRNESKDLIDAEKFDTNCRSKE